MNGASPTVQLNQRGFTLVELMVALVLGLILTGGVINIYISSKQTYRMQDNQSRLQENGRFALQYLTKDIRMAGYMGCNNFSAITPNIISTSPAAKAFSTSTIIQGYDTGAWPAAFPFTQPPNYVAGTSVVAVNFAISSGIFVVAPIMPPTAAAIFVSPNTVFKQNDIVFITDCSSADVFGITNNTSGGGPSMALAHGASNNSPSPPALSKQYGTDAMALKFQTNMFYIGYITGGACPCALYRQTLSGTDRLVDNVRDMQISYGVDTNGDSTADEYLTAAAVGTLWPSVISTRVNLLVTTPENNLVDTPQVYNFNGGFVTAADRRLYSSFTDTITLRNRTP